MRVREGWTARERERERERERARERERERERARARGLNLRNGDVMLIYLSAAELQGRRSVLDNVACSTKPSKNRQMCWDVEVDEGWKKHPTRRRFPRRTASSFRSSCVSKLWSVPAVSPCCRVRGAGFRVQGSGFRVQGSGFRAQGSGSRVQGFVMTSISRSTAAYRTQPPATKSELHPVFCKGWFPHAD